MSTDQSATCTDDLRLQRHFFTSSLSGSLGSSGFQTVACAEGLGRDVAAIEKIVASFRDREPPGASYTSFQVRQLPGSTGRSVLTRFTPTGRCPDGRMGNFLAESMVAPADWLADFGWDTDAACEQLDWLGPSGLAAIPAWPALFPAEPLPMPREGALDRLAPFTEVSARVLNRCLLAITAQAETRQPIAILERPGASPGVLDRLVALVPLLVPPPGRLRATRRGERPIEYRTRGRSDPEFDLCGVSASCRSERDIGGGVVFIDLADEDHSPLPRQIVFREYVGWAQAVVSAGDWTRLALCYRMAGADEAPASFLSRFREIEGTLGRPEGGA